MVNIFKKIARGTNNVFKKIDNGASNFFKKLPNQVNGVVGQVKDGLNKGLDVVGDTARKVGNSLEKYAAPIVNAAGIAASIAMPEFSPLIMGGVAASNRALTAATSMSKAIQSGARQGQAVTNQLAQQVSNKSNQVLGQAQKGVTNGISNLQSQANNAMMKGQQGYNNAVQNAASQLTIH